MLLIVELMFFVAGIYMLVKGVVPQGVFGLLFGRKYVYPMEGGQARMVGALLAFPLLVGVVLALLFYDGSNAAWLFLAEPVVVILVAVIALGIVRRHRRLKEQE